MNDDVKHAKYGASRMSTIAITFGGLTRARLHLQGVVAFRRCDGAGQYARVMDRLEIRLAPHKGRYGGRWIAVELIINGENLSALVASYERARGFKPAGGYDCIDLDGLQPAVARLTGVPSMWPGDGETVLLVCKECGEEGCSPIFARVSPLEDVVKWSGFRQPFFPDRDYTDLHFTFDRRQYDAEIHRAFGQP